MAVLTAATASAVAGTPGEIHRMEVPEWDCEVCYTQLHGLLVTKLAAISHDGDTDKYAWLDLIPEILHDCVVDEDGNTVFTWEQVRNLLSDPIKSAVAVNVAHKVIEATNLDAPEGEAEGN